ncbi:MAG: hypothetical protein ACLT3D_11755 [Lawsonibacter sp.]
MRGRCCGQASSSVRHWRGRWDSWIRSGVLLGPAPAAVAKINDRYRYRLTLTAQNSRALRQLLAALLRAAHQDRENRGVSLYADLNPY